MTNKKINYEQESGRSMVEMLGVLAIIGVLSVGGISGYTTAMNKHKANEILNAAAVRAMVVSTQLQNGATTPTLDEFTENKVGDATFTGVSTAGDKFTIGFNMDNNAVLDQMKNIAGTDGIVRAITSGGLTYNDDLSTEVRASDFDNDSTNCVEPKYHLCSGSGRCLDAGTDCNTSCSGPAPACKSVCDATGSWVVDAENDVGKACKVSASSTENDGVCNASGVCEERIEGKTCNWENNTNNARCGGKGSGYYCNLEGQVSPTGSWEDGSCYTFDDGTCQAVGGLKGSGNYTKDLVNWYTGYSFCQGLGTKGSGMSMVTGQSPSKITCSFPSGSCTATGISNHPDYYWLDTCTDSATYSTTKSCSSEHTCYAFIVGDGHVHSNSYRYNGNYYAVCE